jgi:hypothetical protein
MARRLLSLLIMVAACSSESPPGALGELALSLTAHAGGADYRLVHARFALAGAEERALTADGAEELAVELRAGSYTLNLLDGWALERLGDGGVAEAEVEARLVSENPLKVEIAPAATTRAVLRFELVRAEASSSTGTLAVALEVDASGGEPPCTGTLRISELDPEQPGQDDAEFVEIVSTGACAAPLAGVLLELINGGDGEVYARYELAEAADVLEVGERLLVADAAAMGEASAVLALRASGLQNGPDALRLVRGGQLLDAVAYGGSVADVGEGAAAARDTDARSLSRCPDGFDSDANDLDFRATDPTPGAANACE